MKNQVLSLKLGQPETKVAYETQQVSLSTLQNSGLKFPEVSWQHDYATKVVDVRDPKQNNGLNDPKLFQQVVLLFFLLWNSNMQHFLSKV